MRTKLLEDKNEDIKESDWIKFRGKCIVEGKRITQKLNEFITKEVENNGWRRSVKHNQEYAAGHRNVER